jgi:hypothetical protein
MRRKCAILNYGHNENILNRICWHYLGTFIYLKKLMFSSFKIRNIMMSCRCKNEPHLLAANSNL